MFCTFWHRPLCDVGYVGPDKGKGGKYLLLPPGYKGEKPDGYFTFPSETYRVFLFWRGFLVDGKTDQAVETIEKTKVYPLGKRDSAAAMVFPNASKKPANMLVTPIRDDGGEPAVVAMLMLITAAGVSGTSPLTFAIPAA